MQEHKHIIAKYQTCHCPLSFALLSFASLFPIHFLSRTPPYLILLQSFYSLCHQQCPSLLYPALSAALYIPCHPTKMNYPSRVDPKALPNGWNQNPNSLALDTNNDSNGIANLREQRNHRIISELPLETDVLANGPYTRPPSQQRHRANNATSTNSQTQFEKVYSEATVDTLDGVPSSGSGDSSSTPKATNNAHRISMGKGVIRKWAGNVVRFRKFIGPGFMVAVAYIDPGMLVFDIHTARST